MNLRLQAEEVEIPEEAPFANDLLDPEDSIQTLSRLLTSLDGPSVVAVDAGWGMGKTTFLRMWAEHLRLDGVRVAVFNAWRTDFAREPFIALSSELAAALSAMPELAGRAPLHRFKQAAGGVARAVARPTARVALSAVPGVGGQIAAELSPGPHSAYREESERYAETRRAREEFRETLAAAAAQVAAATDGRPLVVMIDELDRCRPTYAIELLELAKHLFDVEHVVFVLCLNRSQLAESVRVIYGEHFDASEYLRRFFDIDYRLPSPGRERFIGATLGSLGIVESIAAEKRGWFGGSEPEFPKELLPQIFDRPQLSLREIQQTIQRLAVILASIPEQGNLRGNADRAAAPANAGRPALPAPGPGRRDRQERSRRVYRSRTGATAYQARGDERAPSSKASSARPPAWRARTAGRGPTRRRIRCSAATPRASAIRQQRRVEDLARWKSRSSRSSRSAANTRPTVPVGAEGKSSTTSISGSR